MRRWPAPEKQFSATGTKIKDLSSSQPQPYPPLNAH
jgi:hypothetical protein